ncbi:MAG TPA: DUF3592 domain-containing protein [Luteolibacter sp.]|nr:DUF3592 domain-containing protein [Luteolibacter sp.]
MEIFTFISFAVCLLAIPVIIGIAIFFIVRRGMQMKNLAHHGVPATGKILLIKQLAGANRSPQSRSWRLRYSYTVEGRTFENGINPGAEERQLEVGGPIEIVYLPTDPKISATLGMVNLSRQALKLPPLL